MAGLILSNVYGGLLFLGMTKLVPTKPIKTLEQLAYAVRDGLLVPSINVQSSAAYFDIVKVSAYQ